MLFSGLFAASLAALTQLAAAANYSNPLRETNGSDPQIVWYDGYYYLMTTTWTDVQLTRATTIEGLKTGERKTVWVDEDPSRCCSVWAPGMWTFFLVDFRVFSTSFFNLFLESSGVPLVLPVFFGTWIIPLNLCHLINDHAGSQFVILALFSVKNKNLCYCRTPRARRHLVHLLLCRHRREP